MTLKKIHWVLVVNGRSDPREFASFDTAQRACATLISKNIKARVVEVRTRDVTPAYEP